MRTLSHNSDTDSDLMRDFEFERIASGCHNCGDYEYSPAGNAYLFKFGIRYNHNGRLSWYSGRFCSNNCFHSYHDDWYTEEEE